MKAIVFALFLIILSSVYADDSGIVGEVTSVEGCSKEVMVWLSLDKENYNEKLLLMHTLVPKNGKFQFYLRPGKYELRATDEAGCEFSQKVKIGIGAHSVLVRMVKK